MKDKYLFYYDESYHDRSITKKDETLNIYHDNSSINFVTSIIGFSKNNSKKIFDKFLKFEDNVRKIYKLEQEHEIKGTLIKPKNFKYGIASMNKNSIMFYNDFFNLFDSDLIIQLTFINKVFFIIQNIFRVNQIKLENYVGIKEIFFTLAKVICTYRPKIVLDKIFNCDSTDYEVIESIIKFINDINKKNYHKRFKENEINTLDDFKKILEKFDLDISFRTNNKYRWNYKHNILAIELLLNELKIKTKKVKLCIDEEENTVNEARKYNFRKVKSVNSKQNIGIRMSDILCNFFSRMLKAIDDQFKYDYYENVKFDSERKILDSNWFNLKEKQFSLYKLIGKMLKDRENIYYTTYSTLYSGNAIILFQLIEYISSFDSYQDFMNSGNPHGELVNTMSISKLDHLFY